MRTSTKIAVRAARAPKRYRHPVLLAPLAHLWSTVQLFPGSRTSASTAHTTDPSEKNTESAVSQYCLCRGRLSRKNVPSVGMLPPTPVPRQKHQRHAQANPGDTLSSAPNTAVTTSVRLNA